jgi:hypothetical protein
MMCVAGGVEFGRAVRDIPAPAPQRGRRRHAWGLDQKGEEFEMLRNIGAFLAGMIAGMIWNMGLVTLNSEVLYPMPEGMDMHDPEQFKTYVATLPTSAFLVVLAAHVGQAAIGAWVAARLAGSRPALLANIIGVLTAAGVAYNQVVLEAPAWMWIDVPLCLAAAWLMGDLETKRRAARS